MGSPSIAHYGTTIIEAPPPNGAVQKDVPRTGDLARTLRLLEIMGFKPLIENMYARIGRQYIWRRGNQARSPPTGRWSGRPPSGRGSATRYSA
jgi:hypothetical protein